MKRLIIAFLLILASVWLGIKVYEQPGYILIYYQHWAIETTTWFVCLVLLLVLLLLHLVLNILSGTVHLPSRIGNWWQTHQQRKALKFFISGFTKLLTGQDKKAEKALLKSAQHKELAFLSYLIAAQAADEQRATIKRDHYLTRAKKEVVNKNQVADIMQVQFFLKNKQPEQALTLLLQLRQQHPKDAYLLKLHAETYLQLKDWYHLQDILSELKKYKAFAQEEFKLIEKETYLHSLTGHYFVDFSEVQTLWNKMPRHLRHEPEILIAYATHLNRWNRNAEAEEVIRKELKKHFDSRLMEYYVTARSEEPAKQIALAEKYLKENSNDPVSLRAMGVLCLSNRLWGQARDYLEASLKLKANPEAYSALGYVYEKLGENNKALQYYRKGLSYLTRF